MFSVDTTLGKFGKATVNITLQKKNENKTRAQKYHNYCKVIVYEKLRFQNVFVPN